MGPNLVESDLGETPFDIRGGLLTARGTRTPVFKRCKGPDDVRKII